MNHIENYTSNPENEKDREELHKMQEAYNGAAARLALVNPEKFDELSIFTLEEKNPEKIKEFLETQNFTPEEKYFLEATYYLRLAAKKFHGE